MSTNSRIAIQKEDGSVDSVYCHWDGYPDGVGLTLYEHYQDEDKIKELITLGSISSLRENVHPQTPDHSFDTPEDDTTIAYHRDRDEELEIDHYDNLSSWSYKPRREEWNYIWSGGEWLVQGSTHKNLVALVNYMKPD